jgi:hypothetical protein
LRRKYATSKQVPLQQALIALDARTEPWRKVVILILNPFGIGLGLFGLLIIYTSLTTLNEYHSREAMEYGLLGGFLFGGTFSYIGWRAGRSLLRSFKEWRAGKEAAAGDTR